MRFSIDVAFKFLPSQPRPPSRCLHRDLKTLLPGQLKISDPRKLLISTGCQLYQYWCMVKWCSIMSVCPIYLWYLPAHWTFNLSEVDQWAQLYFWGNCLQHFVRSEILVKKIIFDVCKIVRLQTVDLWWSFPLMSRSECEVWAGVCVYSSETESRGQQADRQPGGLHHLSWLGQVRGERECNIMETNFGEYRGDSGEHRGVGREEQILKVGTEENKESWVSCHNWGKVTVNKIVG